MSSWLDRLRGGRKPTEADARAEPAEAPLEEAPPEEAFPPLPPPGSSMMPVRVFGPDGQHSLEIETGGDRVTDALNRLDEAEAETMLLVVPPAQESDRRRRLHRPGQSLRVRIEPYDVAGLVHVPPGSQPTGFLGRVNPRFVPLTDVLIRLTDGGPDELRVSVVIVNLRRAQEVREIAAADREPRERPAEAPPS